jgi:galactitol-specific phosphotransferase system IIB component
MDELKYEKVGEANSRAEAEVIESFLKAEGIEVELVEESISAYPIATARVEIFVPNEKAKKAYKLLKPFDDIQPEDDDKDE